MADTAIDRLIWRVRRGDLRPVSLESDLSALPQKAWPLVGYAYNGSLDAARDLHAMLCPGWGWELQDELGVTIDKGAREWKDVKTIQHIGAENIARDWLICILEAQK